MKKTIFLFMLFILFIPAYALAFTTSGFQNPYGVVIDPKTNFIYVSNVNGSPDSQDGNGFISRLKGDGTVDQMRFIDGSAKKTPLNAPKGMAVLGIYLYVADINKLRVFNLESGAHLYDINFGSLPVQHFYDVKAGPDGMMYVVDGPGNTIYRIDIGKQHEVTAFVSGPELGQPHSICWQSARQIFVVAGWSSGEIKAFDRSGKREAIPSIYLRTLEGMDADDRGNIYVASASLGAIYRLAPNFALFSFGLGLVSPAGVVFHRAGGEMIVAMSDPSFVRSFRVERSSVVDTPAVVETPQPPATVGRELEPPPGADKPLPALVGADNPQL